jgi:IS30 family transposase
VSPLTSPSTSVAHRHRGNARLVRTPNGLLRQYFPKGTDLSVHSALDLDWVGTELNDRPRKRLGFAKPIEEIGPLLLR